MNGAVVACWREVGGWGGREGWARFLEVNGRREAVSLRVGRQTGARSALHTSVPKDFDAVVGATRELRGGVRGAG